VIGRRLLAVILTLSATQAAAKDQIVAWNEQTNLAIQASQTDPFNASRVLALESIAVLDTIKAVAGERGFLVQMPAPPGIDGAAAAAAAGHTMLVALFPDRRAELDRALATSLAALPAGTDQRVATAFGTAVAQAVFALRVNDGSRAAAPIRAGTAPGEWRPTPPSFQPPLLTQWAALKPFTLTAPNQFRPPGPPAPGTPMFREAVATVSKLGSARSTVRTAEQTQIAHYWSDAIGTYAPAGHWNAIAASVAAAHGLSPLAEAEMFAELNVAMADACIAMADAKYSYWYWRPITAIRAGSDGVPAIPDWEPLLETPNHPSYISGHSSFSGAASVVLTAWLGDREFRFGSESVPGLTRHFASFTAAAEEAAMSRVYGGIHFTFDNADGLATGRKVGAWTLAAFKDVSVHRPGG